VHHSDRGVQYASAEYVAILTQHAMVPSMSRPANPYDNASCESFFKTLKREEIYALSTPISMTCASTSRIIERYYNQKRLYSAWATARQWSSSKRPIALKQREAQQ